MIPSSTKPRFSSLSNLNTDEHKQASSVSKLKKNASDTDLNYATDILHKVRKIESKIKYLSEKPISEIIKQFNKGEIEIYNFIQLMVNNVQGDGNIDYEDAILEIIQNKIDVNTKDKFGQTVLKHMVSMNLLGATKKMIDLGAKLDGEDIYGNTIVNTASRYAKNKDILVLLSPILPEYINHPNKNGTTPIMEAVENLDNCENTQVIEFLLSQGADISKCDRDGKNVLDMLVKKLKNPNCLALDCYYLEYPMILTNKKTESIILGASTYVSVKKEIIECTIKMLKDQNPTNISFCSQKIKDCYLELEKLRESIISEIKKLEKSIHEEKTSAKFV